MKGIYCGIDTFYSLQYQIVMYFVLSKSTMSQYEDCLLWYIIPIPTVLSSSKEILYLKEGIFILRQSAWQKNFKRNAMTTVLYSGLATELGEADNERMWLPINRFIDKPFIILWAISTHNYHESIWQWWHLFGRYSSFCYRFFLYKKKWFWRRCHMAAQSVVVTYS